MNKKERFDLAVRYLSMPIGTKVRIKSSSIGNEMLPMVIRAMIGKTSYITDVDYNPAGPNKYFRQKQVFQYQVFGVYWWFSDVDLEVIDD